MQIKIDGHLRDIVLVNPAYRNWTWFNVIGIDSNGRRCPVSQHSVPDYLFTDGGKVRTSGHVYEFAKEI